MEAVHLLMVHLVIQLQPNLKLSLNKLDQVSSMAGLDMENMLPTIFRTHSPVTYPNGFPWATMFSKQVFYILANLEVEVAAPTHHQHQ